MTPAGRAFVAEAQATMGAFVERSFLAHLDDAQLRAIAALTQPIALSGQR